MANNRDDFEPSFRNKYWWASDSSSAVLGKASETVARKIGILPPLDLSGVEKVQMGHVMEPVVLGLAQERLKTEVIKIDEYRIHPKETWLASHTDGGVNIGGRRALVEAKNLGEDQLRKFGDDGSAYIPENYLAQCIHEAICFDVDLVYLACLFGGQKFMLFKLEITPAQKDKLIQDMAILWGHVASKTPLPPDSTDLAKLMYAEARPGQVVANRELEVTAAQLKTLKADIKKLEARADQWILQIQSALQDKDELVSFDGSTLVTWRQSRNSTLFSQLALKEQMPDIYNKFLVNVPTLDEETLKNQMPSIYEQFLIKIPGSRRFLIK